MMKFVIHISVFAAIVMLLSCSPSRQEIKEPGMGNEKYKAIAFHKYGAGVEYLFNGSKSAVLCLKRDKPTSEHPGKQLAFMVFDFSMDSTIFEDEIANGAVAWKDNSSVVVTTVPGIVKNEDLSGGKVSGYIFDLRTRKTRNLDVSDVQ